MDSVSATESLYITSSVECAIVIYISCHRAASIYMSTKCRSMKFVFMCRMWEILQCLTVSGLHHRCLFVLWLPRMTFKYLTHIQGMPSSASHYNCCCTVDIRQVHFKCLLWNFIWWLLRYSDWGHCTIVWEGLGIDRNLLCTFWWQLMPGEVISHWNPTCAALGTMMLPGTSMKRNIEYNCRWPLFHVSHCTAVYSQRYM